MSAPAETDRKIRVLIVDDSAAVRTTLSDIIASDPELEVMATAAQMELSATALFSRCMAVVLTWRFSC